MRKITAEAIYNATTGEKGGTLNVGYTALETYGRKGWVARYMMEVERQLIRTVQAEEAAKTPQTNRVQALGDYRHDRLDAAIAKLQDYFNRHGHEMMSFAVLQTFSYGFRVKLTGYKVVKYIRRVRGAQWRETPNAVRLGEERRNVWRAGPNNVPVVLDFTNKVLEEGLAHGTQPIRTVSARPTA